MLKFKDIVQSLKNRFKMQNVYDCIRPFFFVMSLFGIGAKRILNVDGVYSLHNTRYSIIMTLLTSICTPWYMLRYVRYLFSGRPMILLHSVGNIVQFLMEFLLWVPVAVGCIRTYVFCKDLDKAFKIINNIDVKLQQENVKITHWKITLAVTVIGLLTFDYINCLDIASDVPEIMRLPLRFFNIFMSMSISIVHLTYYILLHLFYVWVILFLLIIYERFVSINKLFLQNARVTNIRIIGCRNLRGDYLLRRISMARELDGQLSEAIVLFSNVYRYMIAGILLHSLVNTFNSILYVFYPESVYVIQINCVIIFIECIRIITIISICQAYKEERQFLAARLRYMISHETDRRIIQQVQQYILYNATCVTVPIDFQFTGVDNVLLFTIIDLLISNVLIVYSYAR